VKSEGDRDPQNLGRREYALSRRDRALSISAAGTPGQSFSAAPDSSRAITFTLHSLPFTLPHLNPDTLTP
jgi:hypothetical protein